MLVVIFCCYLRVNFFYYWFSTLDLLYVEIDLVVFCLRLFTKLLAFHPKNQFIGIFCLLSFSLVRWGVSQSTCLRIFFCVLTVVLIQNHSSFYLPVLISFYSGKAFVVLHSKAPSFTYVEFYLLCFHP